MRARGVTPDGPGANTIVFVPGALCTSDVFAHQIASLSDRFDIVVADHTRAASVREIAATLLESVPRRFALCGISMGGYVCFEVLRQAPERIAKAVLVSTTARADSPEAARQRRAWVQRCQSGDFPGVLDELLASFVAPQSFARPVVRDRIMGMAAAAQQGTFLRQMSACGDRCDSRGLLATIRCPTLIISGALDDSLPRALQREMALGIPQSRLHVIPETGHLPTIESEEIVTDLLRAFL